jgi:biopolymer transport protein ExbB/TolQ
MAKSDSRLLAADERGLPTTVLVAGGLVAVFAFGLAASVSKNTWWHDFFFKRSFVQWVLLTAFAIGFVHLLRRLPAWLRERRALRDLQNLKNATTADTLVSRRWDQIEAAKNEHGIKTLGQYAKNLAEHDEAEVEAAYRLSGDVVQILPLIGFFGTVFGLSHGLYQSFLATGGTTTKDFAKAIAIAFDNTLLGLALTIILFMVQSILRKREEALLLQLNLRVNDVVASAVQEPVKDPFQAAIEDLRTTMARQQQALNDHAAELEKSRKVLEAPAEGVKELIQAHTTEVATAVFKEMAELEKGRHAQIAQTLLSKLEEQARKLLDVVAQATGAHAQSDDPMRTHVAEINTTLKVVSSTAQSISSEIASLEKNAARPLLEELSATVKSLLSALSERDRVMLERVQALEETKGKLAALAAETHDTAQAVAGFGTKLDAVPNERQKVQDLCGAIKELATALAQRDSVMLTSLQGALDTHSREIKGEIRRPRTIKFEEAAYLQSRDGEPESQ